MSTSSFEQPPRRREDARLLTGQGRYTDDIGHLGALHAVFVRSPYPAARVLAIDSAGACAMPGVVAVLTGADMRTDGHADWSIPAKLATAGGGFASGTARPLLVHDRVRSLGEPVAMVLAETVAAAQDGAECVHVEYGEEPAVLDALAAAEPGAPQLWDDRPGNLAYHWRHGDADGVAQALAASHHVARLVSHVSRVCAMPMEPPSALAYAGEDGRPVLRLAHQGPHGMRDCLAACFGLAKTELRVIAEDVGGSFGLKSGFAREEALVFWAARRNGRPVRWTASRSEAFLSDDQGRDVLVTAELGLDAEGSFTALRVRYDLNIGAYMDGRTIFTVLNFGGIAGVYGTPLIAGEALGRFTNTHPVEPYRGAGRPEATFAIERVIDVAATEMGLDPVGLRRRNLIPTEAMPYQTPFMYKYDSGDFARNMDRAVALAGYHEFAERRREACARGRLRGIGVANPIEVAAGPYPRPATDWARVHAHPDGTVTVLAGQKSAGQGLETAFSSVVARRLGIPLQRIRYVDGDTDALASGKGNGGSAAMALGGTVVMRSVEALIEKAVDLASELLEAALADIALVDGAFRIVGSDRVVSLADLAGAAEARDAAGLFGAAQVALDQPTYPNGCHICEVEIEPETGETRVVAYTSVEDVGRVVNPVMVEGQIHGGVAQGLGQVILEAVRYSDSQMVTGSFMDYAMPRAADLAPIVSENLETPTKLNPLGAKGVGEAGTVGALAAAMNAVHNALAPLGVRHIEMPATPERVWQALQEAGCKASLSPADPSER